MKKLFTLAALLTSSLASAVDLAELENKYYVGLNFGGEYSGGLNLRPNLLIGYHYKKSSKLELEINSNIHSLENIGVGLLANYRYYPDIDLGPVTLYVSGGLGGYVQIIGGTSSDSGGTKKLLENSDGGVQGNHVDEESQDDKAKKVNISDQGEGNEGVESGSETSSSDEDESSTEVKVETELYALEATPAAEETPETTMDNSLTMHTSETISDQSSTNKILGYIAYKLKIGVDYKFTPRIIGAIGLNLSGSLNSLSQIGTGIEVGIRYNF